MDAMEWIVQHLWALTPIYRSIYLSVYLSLYLSFYLSIYRSVQRVNLESNLTRQLLCVQAEKHVNQWL